MYITLSELLSLLSLLLSFGIAIFLLAKYLFQNKKK